jgi:hypothetical protein
MVKLLLEHGAGATIDLAGAGEGCTALGAAARRGLVDIVEVLLAAGADPNALDVDRYTALDRAEFGLREADAEDLADGLAERIARIRALLSRARGSG